MAMQFQSGTSSVERRERAERFTVKQSHHGGSGLTVLASSGDVLGLLEELSSSGMLLRCADISRLDTGMKCEDLRVQNSERCIELGTARVVRSYPTTVPATREGLVALAFAGTHTRLLEELADDLQRAAFMSDELLAPPSSPRTTRASDLTIDKFYGGRGRDLFAKCHAFRSWVDDLQARGLFQRFYRVTSLGELGNRSMVFDPIQRVERSMVCFDSNSYLCLHDHPRVVERSVEVMRSVGYGSPSAQLLGGTNKHLRELELALSAFHGREDAIVFPTGFAANAGAISALLRPKDALLRDRLAHASIQEACRAAPVRFNRVFRHNDMASLEHLLKKADGPEYEAKLVVTDGVFSMHGRIAPLPELVAVTRRYGAKLMVDDAHGVGVIGRTGGGIEEHFDMPGSVDVLMGTLSKTLGALGGYVVGSRDLINYLRFFAPSSMFTTATPAALCAGMVEALRIIRDEPQHLQALHRNIAYFVPALHDAGFIVPEAVSPIVTVFLGEGALMWEFNRELFDLGIKCSAVMYPAVPKDEAILRIVLTSKHTPEDLAFTVERLTALGRKYDILHRSRAEIVAIGRRLRDASDAPSLALPHAEHVHPLSSS